MSIYLLPKTRLGKWSPVLVLTMLLLFFLGSSFANTLYATTSSGANFLADICRRPAVALTMLAGMASGISAFITGILTLIKQKDYSMLVFLSTTIGGLLVLFLFGEIIFPH